MKKLKLILALSLFIFAVTAMLVACDNSTEDKDITGVTFSDVTVTYDGQEHEITVKGNLPAGAQTAYENNKATDVGVYKAKVTITCEGYKTLTLTATLTINEDPNDTRLTITGVTFENLTVDYNGQEQQITVSGVLPDGAIAVYEGNYGTNAGTYNATAKITCDGYKPLTLQAKLVINKIDYDMSKVQWNYGVPFVYNGAEQTVIIASGLPDGVSVKKYTGNVYTDAGNYTAMVEFDYDAINYNAPSIANLSWSIAKADITADLTLADDTVEYDTFGHSLQLVGNVPSGVTVRYYYNNVQTDSVSEVGDYSVKCELTGKNYNSKTLTATLKIVSTEKALYSITLDNGTVFFQNDLDDDKLYKVTASGVTKVNNDVPKYMTANGNTLYYYSSSLFSRVIMSYDNSARTTLYSTNGEYLATDGTNIYYAINNLLINTDQNGIYKLNLNGSDAEPVRLVTDKAKYLTYNDGYVYYSNVSDNEYLYRVSVNGSASEKLWEEKVSYLISDGNNLYFNSTKEIAGTVGYAAAIYKYVLSSGKAVKLTTDAGKYLTKAGSYVYYVNNDKLTSTLFGDGIYRISALQTSDNSLPGNKILSADNDGYSSLTSDGNTLYYYKLNDKHFYKYDLNDETETDLMSNFVPVDDTTLAGFSRVAEYKGEIYYTNPLDTGCLYKYNPQTRATFKVLANSVSNVSFYSYDGVDYMYYSTYVLTNYALFRMNLTTNEIEKVTSKRVENLIFEGDKIYCTRVSAGTSYLMQMDLNGQNEVELYKKTSLSSVGLEKHGNTFYFILDPATFGYKNVCVFTIGDSDKTDLHRASNFVTVNGKIYFFAHTTDHSSSDNKEANALKVCNLDGSNTITIKQNVDITDMYAYEGKIYFTSKSSQNTGLYEYDIEKGEIIQISDKQAHGMTMCQGKLYFLQSEVTYTVDYATQNQKLDGKLYCYDGTTVSKVSK